MDDGGGISIHHDSGASADRSEAERRYRANVTGDDGGGVRDRGGRRSGEATGKLVISKSKITRNHAIGNFGGGVFTPAPVR